MYAFPYNGYNIPTFQSDNNIRFQTFKEKLSTYYRRINLTDDSKKLETFYRAMKQNKFLIVAEYLRSRHQYNHSRTMDIMTEIIDRYDIEVDFNHSTKEKLIFKKFRHFSKWVELLGTKEQAAEKLQFLEEYIEEDDLEEYESALQEAKSLKTDDYDGIIHVMGKILDDNVEQPYYDPENDLNFKTFSNKITEYFKDLPFLTLFWV